MPEIDLAPGHKLGLVVQQPLLLSPMAAGFGDMLPHGLRLADIGAIIVGPVSADGRGYTGPSLLVEIDGGVLVRDTGFSRSARRAVARDSAAWERVGCPVLVQVVDAAPADLARSARHLAHASGIAGIEWSLPPTATPALVNDGVRALTQHFDAPIWVKLPLQNTASLAERAVAAGAAGVVIGQPLQGAAIHTDPVTGKATLVTGALHGPATFAAMLRVLREVANTQPGCALLACGGVHHQTHIQQALAAGAHAVQIDSALWREGMISVG
jgi:dihydroorotate dehydrogenase (NAD+) catalytic subunit